MASISYNMKTRIYKNSLLSFLILVSVLFSSCHVMLISQYDEVTDKTVTQMQKDVSRFFIDIKRKVSSDTLRAKAAYENYIEFYENLKVELSSLSIRASAIPKNEIVADQITILRDNIENLEKLHKMGFNYEEELIPPENAFNSAFTAIIKLQLALKRGETE